VHTGGVLVVIGALVGAGVVQSAVIRFDLLPRLAVPLDAHAAIGGRRVFGANKTWRGVLVMMTATTTAVWLIFSAVPPVPKVPTIGWAGLGALMGFAYVVAELPNSFVKRRLGIGAGQRSNRLPALQYLVDQADSVFGVTLVILLVLHPGPGELAELVVLGTLIHAAFDLLRRSLGPTPGPTGEHGRSQAR